MRECKHSRDATNFTNMLYQVSFRFASEKIERCSGMNSATKTATKIAKITKNKTFREAIDKTFDRKMQIRGRICCTYFLFLIISFAKKKTKKNNNKQTNKQKERWQGHRNSCGQLQRARILIKKIKTRNIKKHSDTRKTTATYNKLLDETRDEHCYILNR